jgi:hypothetical protein
MHNNKASILFVVFVVIALIALSHTVTLGSVVMVGSRETCELSGCSAEDLSVRLIHTVFSQKLASFKHDRLIHTVFSQKLASFKHEVICPNYMRSCFPGYHHVHCA